MLNKEQFIKYQVTPEQDVESEENIAFGISKGQLEHDRVRHAERRPPTSSKPGRSYIKPLSENVASAYPAASGGASASPVPSSSKPMSSYSTKPPAQAAKMPQQSYIKDGNHHAQ